jgi:hypothetical protein
VQPKISDHLGRTSSDKRKRKQDPGEFPLHKGTVRFIFQSLQSRVGFEQSYKYLQLFNSTGSSFLLSSPFEVMSMLVKIWNQKVEVLSCENFSVKFFTIWS